jgi:precorrin isomerase
MDVSATKRVKDSAGRYFCAQCQARQVVERKTRADEISRLSEQYNRIIKAKSKGNLIVVAGWTPVALIGLALMLFNGGLSVIAIVLLLVGYVIPLILMTLIWSDYRQNPAPVQKQLQKLIDQDQEG